MYEKLIEKMRCCSDQYRCGDCRFVEDCAGEEYLLDDAADAIESTNKAYQMISEAYEAEVTKQNWIPVTERLPEESWERVLAYTDDGTVMTLPTIKLRNGYVRYWMPLPQPPKKEET